MSKIFLTQNIMQLKQKLMLECHIPSEHHVLSSPSMRFSIAIRLTIYSHEQKVQDHHRIQTQTIHREWAITFLTKIWINKYISKIHYKNIDHIVQLNTIHATSPLYHLKLIFQSPITLHMNYTLDSRRNNTRQFHNKQLTYVKPICNMVPCQ